MEEDGDDLSSPFWLPTSRTHRRSDRIRHSFSSLFFSSGLLIILLLLTAIFFLLFIVPSTLSFSAQIFKPNSVKKSWDYLNLILVLFALLFGFLSRNKNEDRLPNPESPASPIIRNEYPTREVNKPILPASPQKWYDFSDQNQSVYNINSSVSVSSRGGGFLRTSSSYPDLREVSPQVEFTDDPWRFSDDLDWATGSGQLLRRRSWKHVPDDAVANKMNRISEVSTSDVTSPPVTPPPPALSPSPPSPPPLPPLEPALPEEKPKESRKSRNPGHKRGRNKRKEAEIENLEPISPPVAPPPPPPPPPPPLPQFADPKSSKSHKKRSGGNATKDFFNSLYHKKKKKQRQKSVENFDSLFHQNQLIGSPVPPPENISSSKKSTRKRKDPVVSAASTSSAVISSEPKTSQFLNVAMKPPPKSVKVSNFYAAEDNASSGGESPVVNIPPPPPPPPPPPRFSKSLAWKFVVQGDYVRVDSMSSSRSGSPELDDTESDATPTAADVTTAKMSSLLCPSPDVNTKADNFISSFRAGLKLEKVNSMKNKHGLGLSNLGLASNPNKR